MEAVKVSQMAYRLGSMETFMRMVESGKGITFIPELAVAQLTEEQRQLVRPFAIPRPTRQVVLATNRDFIRHSLLCVLKRGNKSCSPKRNAYFAVHTVFAIIIEVEMIPVIYPCIGYKRKE